MNRREMFKVVAAAAVANILPVKAKATAKATANHLNSSAVFDNKHRYCLDVGWIGNSTSSGYGFGNGDGYGMGNSILSS